MKIQSASSNKTASSKSKGLVFAITIGILFSLANLAVAQDVCRQVAGQQDYNIRATYTNQLTFWTRIAGALQSKGVNPSNFPQAMPNGEVQIINIPSMLQMLATQRDTGLRAVFEGFQQCEAGFAPYQQIINIGMFFTTAGLSQVIPPAATYVDASQILSGTPFGGPNALIPKARDDVLNGLGIGGDVAKVIRNPICVFGC
jgi:hypothetical protein